MAKTIGNGTTVKFSTDSTTATSTAAGVVTLGGVLSISGPDTDAPDIDLHTLDSTSNYVSNKRGFATKGDISMTVAYDAGDTGWAKIKAFDASGKVGKVFVVYPTGSTFGEESCKAYVKGVGRSIERDAMITRTVTVHPSSDPNWN